MPIRFSQQRALLLAATLATALAACPAAAQQSTPTPPPPTPNQPTSDAATKLRGINPPPFPMAADKLPVPQLKLPKGFKIEVFMSGVPNARSLRLGDKGTVFVSNRLLDKVYAIVDRGGRRETKVIASGLDRPNGLAFHQGTLYIAEGTKISKLERIEDQLDKDGPWVNIGFTDHLPMWSAKVKGMGLEKRKFSEWNRFDTAWLDK